MKSSESFHNSNLKMADSAPPSPPRIQRSRTITHSLSLSIEKLQAEGLEPSPLHGVVERIARPIDLKAHRRQKNELHQDRAMTQKENEQSPNPIDQKIEALNMPKHIDTIACLTTIGLLNYNIFISALTFFNAQEVPPQQLHKIIKQTSKRKSYAQLVHQASEEVHAYFTKNKSSINRFIQLCETQCALEEETLPSSSKKLQEVKRIQKMAKNSFFEHIKNTLLHHSDPQPPCAGVFFNELPHKSSSLFWEIMINGIMPLIIMGGKPLIIQEMQGCELIESAAFFNNALQSVIRAFAKEERAAQISMRAKEKKSYPFPLFFKKTNPMPQADDSELASERELINVCRHLSAITWILAEECIMMTSEYVEKTSIPLCRIINQLSVAYLTKNEQVYLSPLLYIQSAITGSTLSDVDRANWHTWVNSVPEIDEHESDRAVRCVR